MAKAYCLTIGVSVITDWIARLILNILEIRLIFDDLGLLIKYMSLSTSRRWSASSERSGMPWACARGSLSIIQVSKKRIYWTEGLQASEEFPVSIWISQDFSPLKQKNQLHISHTLTGQFFLLPYKRVLSRTKADREIDQRWR